MQLDAAHAPERVRTDRGPSRGVSLGFFLGCVFATFGAVLGSRPLRDNSFLTHLATGRLILESGSVPSVDSYTFTSAGSPWVVQSWLASVVYASLERIGGFDAIRWWTALQMAVLCALIWRLTHRAQSVPLRIALVAATIVASGGWSERPYLLALVFLCVALLVMERDSVASLWLVPLGWLWANTHGGWLLALVLLVSMVGGRLLDQADARLAVRKVVALSAGIASGVVGPLGVSALTFPFSAAAQPQRFAGVVEWQAPTFRTMEQRVFLVLVICSILALVRRPTWSLALPGAVSIAVALMAQRNIDVVLPVIAMSLASTIPTVGSLRCSSRSRGFAAAALACVVLAASAVSHSGSSAFVDRGYPAALVTLLEERQVIGRDRIVAPDFVGNYLTARYGAAVRIFSDDRFDMLPEDLIDDAAVLFDAGPTWRSVLDSHAIEIVIVPGDDPLAQVLRESTEWRIVAVDDRWVQAERRTVGG
jgi:hypothetical protein